MPFVLGHKPTDETRIKISNALKGRKLSYEVRHKMSVSRMCHKISEETKKKIGIANKGKLLGEKSPFFKGEHIKNGYKYIYNPNHPLKTIDNCISEAHLIMEKHLGRYLKPEEVIHHKNSNPLDNRLENLILFESNSKHQKHHYRIKKEGGEITFRDFKKQQKQTKKEI